LHAIWDPILYNTLYKNKMKAVRIQISSQKHNWDYMAFHRSIKKIMAWEIILSSPH